MADPEFDLDALLRLRISPERLARLKQLTTVDLPGLDEGALEILLRKEGERLNLEYGRYLAGTPISDARVAALVEDGIDTHAHGGSEPFQRRLLEHELARDFTERKLRAVVVKTHYTPSASRNALVQRWIDEWAASHGLRPVTLLGGICLNYAVGGLNPEAVRRCLGFPGFRYVWMPSVDSYHHHRVTLGEEGRGIELLGPGGRVRPELDEILRIVADHDLVLAIGHYPVKPDVEVVVETAKRRGVRRIEAVHPNLLHSKWTIAQMKEFAREGVMFGLTGVSAIHNPPPEGKDYFVRVVREVGADHLVFGSDLGQIHNVRHVDGIDWFVRYLLSYKVPDGDIVKIMRTNPARHVGLDADRA